MATVWARKKSAYQTVNRPRSTGRLRSNGAVRKCSSIWWKPSSRARKLSGPTASIVDRPIAESDRKSTRLNSSHGYISYAVFCLKKKKKTPETTEQHQLILAHVTSVAERA